MTAPENTALATDSCELGGADDNLSSLQGHAINPMFGTQVSTGEMFEESPRQQGNPLYDSRRSPSSAGFTTTESHSHPSRSSGRQVRL